MKQEIETLRQQWQAQPLPPAPAPAREALRRRLRLYEQEEGQGASLAGAIAMTLFGLLFLAMLAGGKGLFWGALALAAGFNALRYGLAWQMSRHAPSPDAAPVAYLRHSLRRLRFGLRMQRAAGGIFGACVLIFGWEQLSADPLPLPQSLALSALALIFLGIGGTLLWWYQTQHPWQPGALIRELEEALADWEADQSI